jgi:hypothetical protein
MMKASMKKFLLLILLLGILGCAGEGNETNAVYLAGEIVNPTDRFVVLLKGEQPLDTARLDSQNRFEFRLDSVQEGLHSFKHDPEYQYVYLEGGDSLQIRLNTIAFDESLVFSGRGEEINNFLIELFLESEGEENLIRDAYIPMEPKAFSSRLDSLKVFKLKRLEKLHKETPLSQGAFLAAEASILYQNYLYHEKYPFWHRKIAGDGGLHDLSAGFYDYRKKVSYEDPQLTFLRPYHEFMIYHIGNLAYMGCRKACEVNNEQIGNKLHFNTHQLYLIDSLVTGEELRDNLFRTVAFDYLLKKDTEENFKTFMEEFHRLSGNNRHLAEIDRLSEAIQNLRPDHEVPDLMVENFTGEAQSMRSVSAEGKVVFYFWSGEQQNQLTNIIRRVRALSEDHPDYRFVGICLRTDRERWKTLIDSYSLDPEDQFWTGDFETFVQTLVVDNTYKSVLAKDGKIVNGFANLNTSF